MYRFIHTHKYNSFVVEKLCQSKHEWTFMVFFKYEVNFDEMLTDEVQLKNFEPVYTIMFADSFCHIEQSMRKC